jgi:ubiquinone/menaquinone biosynthesis C-methylase UbiE
MPMRAHAAREEQEAANLRVYRDPEVVSLYASLDYLTACERLLFATYLKPGMAILDIGVGGGRTTPYLSQKASRYVGVDYSEEMVRTCRNKFPGLEFMVADASDLSAFHDASFDAIIIAFNGLDYLFPNEKRWQCLRESRRVLRAEGVLVFSSHNPRSIFARPAWDRERLRAFAGKIVSERRAFFGTMLSGLTVVKSIHSFLRASVESARRIGRRAPKSAFWRGEGYWFDPVHGGCMTHCCTTTRVREELAQFNFQQKAVLGDDHPRRSRKLVTDWYYYVFSKAQQSAGERCA